jgi:hypothetical protein
MVDQRQEGERSATHQQGLDVQIPLVGFLLEVGNISVPDQLEFLLELLIVVLDVS